MGGRRIRRLALGVVIALIAIGGHATALPDVGQSPLMTTDVVAQTFRDLANVQPVPHTFEVPDLPECKPLRDKTYEALNVAAQVLGGQWFASDNPFSVSEDVWSGFSVSSAKKIVRTARPKFFLDCTRATIADSGGMLDVAEIPQLEGPGDLLGDAEVFFASGGQLEDGASSGVVTTWIRYDTVIARISFQVPGTDVFMKPGTLNPEWFRMTNALLDHATNRIWQATEGQPPSDEKNRALDALGVNANYTTEIQPTPPSADLPNCKDLAKLETRSFEVQFTQFWRTEQGSFVEISRGFDTSKLALGYFRDLKRANFTGCQKSVYSPEATPDFKATFKQQELRFPSASKIRESAYQALGGELTIDAGGQTQRQFNLAGALVQDATVRLYFINSNTPTSWNEFQDLATTAIDADYKAEVVG
jgi:hypothetical protein